ncbi:MAG: topoisomerase [Actinomycetota bacterium]|jgi:DNA topoisomerase-1
MSNAISYVRDDQPGITRRGKKRFRYVDMTGREVDNGERRRIESLAIPPAWTNVWICPDPAGHIQATGRDAKGRKQYRYHSTFRQRRESAKFRDLAPFGEALGKLRKQVDADLRHPALTRDRVVAAIVSLMEQTYVRVGNHGYARTNKTYGLTTLRVNHVEVSGGHLHLNFVGKGGKEVDVTCCDSRLARVVRRCQDLPGQNLFQYLNDDGPCAVSSTDVNDYLRAATGLDATAKTFRTWGASLMAAQAFAPLDPPQSPTEFGRVVNETLKPVAQALNNTVTVCRNSYVHPTVLRRYEDGTLGDLWASGPSRAAHGNSADERRLLVVLRS